MFWNAGCGFSSAATVSEIRHHGTHDSIDLRASSWFSLQKGLRQINAMTVVAFGKQGRRKSPMIWEVAPALRASPAQRGITVLAPRCAATADARKPDSRRRVPIQKEKAGGGTQGLRPYPIRKKAEGKKGSGRFPEPFRQLIRLCISALSR